MKEDKPGPCVHTLTEWLQLMTADRDRLRFALNRIADPYLIADKEELRGIALGAIETSETAKPTQ